MRLFILIRVRTDVIKLGEYEEQIILAPDSSEAIKMAKYSGGDWVILKEINLNREQVINRRRKV